MIDSGRNRDAFVTSSSLILFSPVICLGLTQTYVSRQIDKLRLSVIPYNIHTTYPTFISNCLMLIENNTQCPMNTNSRDISGVLIRLNADGET